MGTYCLIFLTIGDLVFPLSFPFAGQVKERTGRPRRTKYLSVLGCQGKLGRQAVGAVVSLVSLARRDVYSYAVRQLDMVRATWAARVFAGPATCSSLSSFSALTQSSTSF